MNGKIEWLASLAAAGLTLLLRLAIWVVAGLALLFSLTGCIRGSFDFGIDSGGYGYQYDYGYRDYGYSSRYTYRINCSRFPLGSEERMACDEGKRRRESDYQNTVYHQAREHGYQRGINGFLDTHRSYCRSYSSLPLRESCENGYRSGYGTGWHYYLEGIRNRSRRGYWP
ncbi:MAG: hypothetical protein UX07_C0007G0024 [Parcubacteria group bacterium GW2011_GWA2_45_30]|nr:MAG: hypothetical protein UX07_C0007G0024 [Parcubacteria group bacterium GW2011_GWA2_45_30]